jgi:class 3 adenylate cyclase
MTGLPKDGPRVSRASPDPRWDRAASASASPTIGLRHWFLRWSAILEWSAVDKSIVGALIFLSFTILYWVIELYLLAEPSVASYVNRAFLPFAFRVQTTMLCGWSIFIAACLVVRRRRPDAQFAVYILMLLCSVTILYGSYFFGFHTSPFFAVAALASLATGYVWYEPRPMTIATGLCVGGAMLLMLAEASGRIPFAPFFSYIPLRDGALATPYLVTLGGMTSAMLLLLIPWVGFIVSEFHKRGARLAHANDLISRYVASQLAAQIHAGEWDAVYTQDRRKLTLFFSDIEGFAATADLTEPEDLAAVLNDYLAEMTEIGRRYGATIDKFVGDAIMIFFGAPSATDDHDHALRAVLMALEMQQRMEVLQAKWQRQGFEYPFRIRVGINTGHASIGNFGSSERMDYTAIGRQVNLAARLQTHCEPGRVLISHSTWVLVQDDVACTPKGEIQVKGFHQPIKVYEVDRLVRAEDAPGAMSMSVM